MNYEEVLGSVAGILEPLQCGEDTLSVLPSLVFCFGMGLLFYKVLRQGRPPLFRRISRDILVQEVIFSWLVNITLKGWLLFLDVLDVLLVQYSRQMTVWFPPTWRSSSPDLSKLPPAVQILLHPLSLKMILCTFISIIPLIVIWKINKENGRFGNFMVWLGHNRWEHTELGLGRYFINRPARVLDPPPAAEASATQNTVFTRHSTGRLLASSYVESIERLKNGRPGPRHRHHHTLGHLALRPSKSLH